MRGLIFAEVKGELAVEVSLRNVDLDAIDVGALVFADGVDVEGALAGVLIGLVDKNVGVDLSLVVDDDLGAVVISAA